jgi:hypothetical protein
MSRDGVGRFFSWLDNHAVDCYGHVALWGSSRISPSSD